MTNKETKIKVALKETKKPKPQSGRNTEEDRKFIERIKK